MRKMTKHLSPFCVSLALAALAVVFVSFEPATAARAPDWSAQDALQAPASEPLAASTMSTGHTHACEIMGNGTLSCWGGDANAKVNPPAGNFKQISSGWMHNCAINTDNKPVCWGFDYYGQASPPKGNFQRIAAGAVHSCGVKLDGNLKCWGANGYGESTPPGGTFKRVTVGPNFSCALRTDGTAACWGANPQGAATPPSGTFANISSGSGHTCAVSTDGSVTCWGANGSGQLNVPPGTYKQVSAGFHHSCAVKTDGALACWGANQVNQAAPPAGTFKEVRAGGNSTCAIRTDNTVVCWGANEVAQAPVLVLYPSALPDGRVGSAYQQQLTVDAGAYTPPSPSFSQSGGSLPPGIRLESDGILKGTPTTEGSYNFAARVVDTNSLTGERAYTLVIGPGYPVVEEMDSAVQYGNWSGRLDAQASGGTLRVSSVKDNTATLKFKGTEVELITVKGPDQGKLRVLIDGQPRGTFDQYAAAMQYGVVLKFDGLTDAKHTLRLEVLGKKNKQSSGKTISVDAFRVGSATKEDTHKGVQYNRWKGVKNTNASGQNLRQNGTAGAVARYTFTGTAVDWLTAKGPGYGKARVVLDGVEQGIYGLYSAAAKWQVPISFSGLSNTQHTLEIHVTGEKNLASTGTLVIVDGFRLPTETSSPGFAKVFAAALPASPTSAITVNSTDMDVNPTDGKCTLREAISAANTDTTSGSVPGECPAGSGADTVHLASGATYEIPDSVAVLPGGDDPLGLPLIMSEIALQGNGATLTRASGAGQFIFIALHWSGKLVVHDMTFTGASAFRGSVIWNEGDLRVYDSLFTGNHADWSGATIQNNSDSAIVVNTTFSSNNAAIGAGYFNGGAEGRHFTTVMQNVTVSDNNYGVFNEHWSHIELYNVLIRQNGGPGLYSTTEGTATITNSTVTANQWFGVGVGSHPNSQVTLFNTIIAGNSCSGPVTDGGNNIDSGNSCGFNVMNSSMVNTDPLLDSDGLTLLAGSPAIDAGNNAVCAKEFVNNQDHRGEPRPRDGNGCGGAICDIGAYEAGAASAYTVSLQRLGTLTHPVGTSEIVAHDPATHRLYVANSTGTRLDILENITAAVPSLWKSVDISQYDGSPNSVAVQNGIVAVAAQDLATRTEPGTVVFFDTDGNFLSQVEVGVQPDMTTFTPDGQYVLTANEGEPGKDASNNDVDPPGSISIIDISGGVASLTSANVTPLDFSGFALADLDMYTRIIRNTVAQDLEPEYIAVSPDSATAWVTLQENNAFAVVDLNTKTITKIIGFHVKDHSQPNFGLDSSDRDGAGGGTNPGNIRTWQYLWGMNMPDGIDTYVRDGVTYLLTANEGDQRSYDVARVKNVILDKKFPPDWQTDAKLGRLEIWNAPANKIPGGITSDSNGDGSIDTLYAFGGRSFSIWKTDGTQVFDSGDLLEKLLFNLDPARFDDTASDNKGPEPESVVYGSIRGCDYAFVGLERGNGIFYIDVTDPKNPSLWRWTATAGDTAPEGLEFISASESPTGKPLLIVANEGGGTTTVYEAQNSTP